MQVAWKEGKKGHSRRTELRPQLLTAFVAELCNHGISFPGFTFEVLKSGTVNLLFIM